MFERQREKYGCEKATYTAMSEAITALRCCRPLDDSEWSKNIDNRRNLGFRLFVFFIPSFLPSLDYCLDL